MSEVSNNPDPYAGFSDFAVLLSDLHEDSPEQGEEIVRLSNGILSWVQGYVTHVLSCDGTHAADDVGEAYEVATLAVDLAAEELGRLTDAGRLTVKDELLLMGVDVKGGEGR